MNLKIRDLSDSKKKTYPPSVTRFPPAWQWLVDEAIPIWVKKHYSPRDSWKDKPFSLEDTRFFFKGIDELSTLFTEERPRDIPAYFNHPKYRSAYLLYFLPLQAAKFLTIFQLFPKAIEAALDHAYKTGTLRVADLGAGPGTASLSLLLLLLESKLPPGKELPPIELEWCDTNADIMEDGKALVEHLSSHFPKLRGKVKIKTNVLPWWKAVHKFENQFSLIFVGHLLNEASIPQRETDPTWQKLLQHNEGGGVLFVEPAARKPAQLLSTLRDSFFTSGLVEKKATRIWGPCLHAEKCPLAQGRDWCHFSAPAQIPGKWFKSFSKSLGSERQWVKFSYFWLTSEKYPSSEPKPELRRVISDPFQSNVKSNVLLCEPEIPRRWPVLPNDRIHRGDLISIQASDQSTEKLTIQVRPPSRNVKIKPKRFAK